MPTSRLTGLISSRAVAVRETPRGFTIEATLDSAPCAARHRANWRDMAVAAAAVAGVAGLWALPIGPNGALPAELKALGATLSAGAGILGWSLFRRPERYIVHIDQVAERIRIGFRGAGDAVDWCQDVAFSEARDLVVKRPRFGPSARLTLCLRTRSAKRPLEIAIGDDVAIRAIHDRVKRALMPVQDDVWTRPHRSRPWLGLNDVFPALGPDEIAT